MNSAHRFRWMPPPATFPAGIAQHQRHRIGAFLGKREQAPFKRALAWIRCCDPQSLALSALFALRLDEQRVESAGLRKIGKRFAAGPVQEGAVGVDKLIVPVDQDAGRQPVEQGALLQQVGQRCALGRRTASPALAAIADARSDTGCPAAVSSSSPATWPRATSSAPCRRAVNGRRVRGRPCARPGSTSRTCCPHPRPGTAQRSRPRAQRSSRPRLRFFGLLCPTLVIGYCIRPRGRAACQNCIETGKIAADAKAAIAAELAVAVIIGRPASSTSSRSSPPSTGQLVQAAPGVARCDRVRRLHRSDRARVRWRSRSMAVRGCGDLRSYQLDEFVRGDGETVFGVHLPHETQGMPALGICAPRPAQGCGHEAPRRSHRAW